MKIRYRLGCEGWAFNGKHVLVVQVLKHFPDGPCDSNGLPCSLACDAWVDATVEDLPTLEGDQK